MDASTACRTRKVACAAVWTALACGAGCTVIEENRNIRATEARIDRKQAALDQEEAQQRQLRQRQQDLIRDLADARLSLDDVNRRLDDLRAANARVAAATRDEQARRQRIDQELAARRAEAQALSRSDLPDADKLRRIEILKRQIQDQLTLQLNY